MLRNLKKKAERTPIVGVNYVMLALPLHGAELSALFFLEYLSSSTFRGDMGEALCNFGAFIPMIRSGGLKSLQALLMLYAITLRDRFLFRAMECVVSAACVYGPAFTQDAVVFHYLYPFVQEYRFSRSFMYRTLSWFGRKMYPAFVRRVVFGSPVDPEVNPDTAYAQSAPRPQPGDAVYESMPEGIKESLQFYYYQHRAHPLYAVAASCFVHEATRFLLEGTIWATRFYKESKKENVTKWRLLKPFFCYCTKNVVELGCTIAARALGTTLATIGTGERTGGTIFWSQNLLLLAVAPGIVILGTYSAEMVSDYLEKKYPSTADDIAENDREQKEQEEENRNSGFYFFEAANAAASGNPQDRERFKKGVDFYSVLGVDEKAQGAEIKKAYRQLALKNHPDRVGSDALAQKNARENMAVINEAYDILINEQTRMQYDASRMFSNSPDFLKKLETLSIPQFVVLGSGSVVGLFLLAGGAAYAQFSTIFQTFSGLGRQPLAFFDFNFSSEGADQGNDGNPQA